MLKRLLPQLIVVILALSTVTACSSSGKKDCKLLLEAKEVFKTNYNDLTPEAQATQTSPYAITFMNVESYILQLKSIQLLLNDPKLREYVRDFLNGIEGIPTQETANFVNGIDIYCDSL